MHLPFTENAISPTIAVELSQQNQQIPTAPNIDSVLAAGPAPRTETYCIDEETRPKQRGRPPRGETQASSDSAKPKLLESILLVRKRNFNNDSLFYAK
jgi:hypothetical protein